MKIFACAIASVLLLTACATPKTEVAPGYRLHDIWVLTHIDGRELSTSDVGTKGAPIFEFYAEEERVLGQAGCNNFTASFSILEPGVMLLSEAGLTRMLCENMDVENMLLSGFFGQPLKYQIADLQLTFTNERGESIRFKKID